jgi:hypothetical protein
VLGQGSEHAVGNVVLAQIVHQLITVSDAAELQDAGVALGQQLGKVGGRETIADLYGDHALRHGEVGDLVVAAAAQPLFLQRVAGEEVVHVALVQDQVWTVKYAEV